MEFTQFIMGMEKEGRQDNSKGGGVAELLACCSPAI
jgi:hypothetical protein